MHDRKAGTEQHDESGDKPASSPDLSPLGTVALNPDHDVAGFVCSKSERVQGFMRDDARKFAGIGYSAVWVWPNPDNASEIWGYYTLSASVIERGELINRHEKKVPKGLPVPIALIGFMGRSDTAPKGLGAVLIHDAALRVKRAQDIGTWGIALEPENDKLSEWYQTLGFGKPKERPRFLYGPLSAFIAEDEH
jgi:hypothetical protein